MKSFLFCLVLVGIVPALSAYGQSQPLDTSNQVTPQQVYYQMLHNDSIYMENFQAIKQYRKIRTSSKVAQLVGGVVLGSLAVLIATDEVAIGSEAYKVMLGAGGGLFIASWITDWVAISKLNKIQSTALGYGTELDKDTYYVLFGKRKK